MTEKKTKKKAASGSRAGSQRRDEEAVLAVIEQMPSKDRTVAEDLHALIQESAPKLEPRLWYGQPAYAKGGKVVCFFRGADIDKERYLTFGFSGEASLDDGHMWPTAYALTGLTASDKNRIKALVKKAVK